MNTLGMRSLLLAALMITPAVGATAQARNLGSRPMRLALLVGINRYANSSQALKGCANDVALTRKMLKARGYGPIITLTNGQATGANIQRALDALTRTKPQDYVYIHFSGYGNKDRTSPVICPADYKPGQGGIAYSSLLSKIDLIPAIRKIAVIDCSFTRGRNTSQTTPRYWPVLTRDLARQNFTGKRSIPGGMAKAMIISAAEKDAPAVETIVDSKNRQVVWAGAMTWAYLRTAQRSNNNTTFQQLRGGIDARMAGRLTQTTSMRGFDLGKALGGLVKILKPAAGLLLSGATGGLSNIVTALLPSGSPKTQEIANTLQTLTDKNSTPEQKIGTVLGLLDKDPAPGQPPADPPQGAQPVNVTEVSGNTVTIDQGLSADVQPGTILEGPTNGSGPPDQIQVVSVGIDSAQGQVVQGDVQPNEQVFVSQTPPPPANDPLVVELSPLETGADMTAITSALTNLGYVRIANPGEVVDRRLVVSLAGAPTANLVSVDIAPDPTALTGAITGMDADDLVRQLAPQLTSAFLMKRLAVLQNPASRIEMSLSVQNQSGQDATNGLQIGDTVTINVQVNRPAFITLLDIAADGKVTVLYPNANNPSIQAQAGTPLQFPPSGQISVAPPAGKEMLLAIATSQPLDISQFDATALPGTLGMRGLTSRGARAAANRMRTLVLQAAPDTTPNGSTNPSEDSGWGSIFIVFPVSG